MECKRIEGSGLWEVPAGWPVLAVLLIEGDLRTGAWTLGACEGLVFHPGSSVLVEYEQARGVLVALPAQETVRPPFVLSPLVVEVLLDAFWQPFRTCVCQENAIAYLISRLALLEQGAELHERGKGDLVSEVIAYMKANLDEPLSMRRLSEVFDRSRVSLAARFKSAGQKAPMQTLADLRIRKAQTCLGQTNQTVSQIAAAVGYKDLAAFSHFFKNQTGQSPREFRENVNWLV